MIVIAENINVMSKSLGPAMKNREAGPIQKMAKACADCGADYLDLNIGPAKKAGPELLDWLVKTVHEAVKLPLYLDTTNMDAIEAGLKAHKDSDPRPVINSISAVPDRMQRLVPTAKKYGAEFVALLYGPDGIPRDENERGALAAELLFAAQNESIALEDMWFDPIVVPVSSQQVQVVFCTNFMAMIPEIAPGSKSTCGLSNISNGAPDRLRPILNQVYLCMLRHNGLKGAILDGLDKEIIAIAKNDGHPMQKLVSRLMSGEAVQASSLSPEEVKIFKTYKVLSNETLYSDSWLEL
jgi:5-methyltetrahydrofolate corrinoid/iron sulfur protein methyltransferase